ncbi:bifunctional acetate--CoA ligase family protein/GNAT family N-acetyltransferase [Pseudovibrio flavus]|uniref:bifunctional acetate--CoA ligase family protein/GNAT family N-acetyltransferase n=1 Tax=Pseudovibrio flavus TaxID=2529854 RepID=UPI00211C88B5|nr:GNAT family N-acetyltransferase [Pseudovibrio flavus]
MQARLASNDLVYDAALQRAGVLRVDDLDEMFHAAETVTRVAPPSGRRLAIVANGRSLATLAADCLERMGGEMAEVSPELKEAVCKLTREDAKASNPLVLQENASPKEFRVGIEAFLADKNCDGVLAIAAPTAFNNLAGIAATIAEVGEKNRKKTGRKKALITTLASGAQIPRAELDAAKVPCFASASEAIRAFMHLVRYREAKDLLMAAPDSLPSDFTPDKPRAKKAINAALAAGERWLSPDQVLDVLSAYQIPQVPMRYVQTAVEAGEAAKPFLKDGHACALKLISPDFTFKSDIDGVLLDLASQEAVQEAAEALIERLNRDYPTARIDGFEIQPMVKRTNSLEVYAGLADSPIFGPVVVFGRGGTAVEVTADRAIELVPLDMNLAGALISRTHTHALLRGFRNRPAANIHELEQLLVKLSQLAVDFPEVRELDLNPVLVDREGLEVVDARIAVAPDTSNSARQGNTRLAIAPYPTEWEHEALLKDGTGIFLRPIRPEDQGLLREFFNHVTTEDLRLRFFAPVKEFSHSFLARLVQLDYARAMAFVAIKPETEEILGVVRLHTDANHNVGEYAVLIQSDMKGKGLGWMLMQLIIRYAKADGIATIKGEVLRENHTMIEMCRALGFTTTRSEDDDALIIATLEIDKQA